LTSHTSTVHIDDPLRRVCNHAFFEKIWITGYETLEAEPNQGFAVVLHPGIQQAVVNAAETGEPFVIERLPR